MARVRELVGGDSATSPAAAPWAAVLSGRERRRAAAICHPGRRAEWLAARVLAKFVCVSSASWEAHGGGSAPRLEVVSGREVWSRAGVAFARVEILPADPAERRGIPEVAWLDGERGGAEICLSISHAAGWVVVAASVDGPVGVDIEAVAARSEAFSRDAFSEAEQAWIARSAVDACQRATLLWTLKEATYKSGACGGDWEPGHTGVQWADWAAAPPPPSVALIGAGGPMSSLALHLHHADTKLSHRAATIGTAAWILSVVSCPQER